MKWFNHGIVATAVTLPIAPYYLPFAVAGSTAPDWIEMVLNSTKSVGYVKHRTITHIVSHWILAASITGFIYFLFSMKLFAVLMWFAIGGLSHVMADMLSGNGVPLTPNSLRPSHLFGARIPCGSPVEYYIAFTLLGCSLFAAYYIHGASSEFFPFFYNWAGMYEDGVIDGFEWRKFRFNFI